jgi:hypothetical protein
VTKGVDRGGELIAHDGIKNQQARGFTTSLTDSLARDFPNVLLVHETDHVLLMLSCLKHKKKSLISTDESTRSLDSRHRPRRGWRRAEGRKDTHRRRRPDLCKGGEKNSLSLAGLRLSLDRLVLPY